MKIFQWIIFLPFAAVVFSVAQLVAQEIAAFSLFVMFVFGAIFVIAGAVPVLTHISQIKMDVE